MRLAVFTTRYPARGATFFRRDMSALLAAGIEVDLFPIYPLDETLWRDERDRLAIDAIPRDRVHNIGIGESLARLRPWPLGRVGRFAWDALAISGSAARFGPTPAAKSVYVLPKAWAWAREFADRYDHVLAYWGNYAGTCAYAFHRLIDRPIPFSLWLHAGTDLYRQQVFLRHKLVYADNIITCCEFNKRYMEERYPSLAATINAKTHVCYHGLDLATFPYRPDGRPPRRIIAVGRMARHKGFDYLMRAAQELQRRGTPIDLELVGDGEELAALKALAQGLGIADRVTFRGWLTFSDVREAMSGATALVHPSDGLGDGLPNVLREAMAVGTPVIASNVAGIPEALDDGRCGTLVPPKDVGALANAIATLLDDASLRRRHAELGRRRTEEKFELWDNGKRLAERLRSTRRRAHPLPTTAPRTPSIAGSGSC
jgi:glycosyltransferase involved in cell wall biosynthesis